VRFAVRRPFGRECRHGSERGAAPEVPRDIRRKPRPHRYFACRARWRPARLAGPDAGHAVDGHQTMSAEAGVQVWGVGVGPGDPELLTLKALRLVRAADVIAYPAPQQGTSFSRSIVDGHLPGGQREMAIRMPIGDGGFPKADIYDAAAADILAEARAGRKVAVLCEGDPFFYGSFMYLYERLAGRCNVAVVPGVSSL